MDKTCNTCYYSKGNKCSIMHSPISGCWADEEEAKKREKDISAYSLSEVKGVLSNEQIERRSKTRMENAKNRNGKSVKETLDEHFNWYYLQGLSDEEIAKEVHVDASRVRDYRRDKGLPGWKKKGRPTATGAAK